MGAVELVVLFLLFMHGKGGGLLSPSASAPSPSVPTPGPPPPPARTTPAATAPPPGAAASPQQAQAATRAAKAPAPFPQAVPPGLPPFPGPGWKVFVPTPPAVVTRAMQLLPVLWATGPGTSKIEQTAGTWTAYVASAGPNGRKDVHAFKNTGSSPGANA